MEPTAMRRAARPWLLQRFASQPRDQTALLRRMIEQDLVALTRRAGAEYARSLLVLAMDVSGRPITASCVVSVLPQRLADEQALQTLAAEAYGAVEAVVADLGANRGVVVVRDSVESPERPDGVDEHQIAGLAKDIADTLGMSTDSPDPAQQWEPGTTRNVEVYLPVPDGAQMLLLSFSTTLVPLFPALTELFVLMACTVQWQGDDGRWGA